MEPSLSELDNNIQNANTNQGGDEPTEAEKQAAADLEAQKVEQARLTEEENQKNIAAKPEEDRRAEEAAKTAVGGADDNASEGGEDDTDPEQFYAEVNKYHGFDEDPIKVEYGEVDPLSPEGIYLRDKALEQYAQSKYEETLQKSFPRAYEYFLHSKAGKPDQEFWSKPDVSLPEFDQLKDNIDLQKKLVVEDLQSRKLSDKSISREIEALIKDGELAAESERVYKARQQAQLDSIEALKKLDIQRQQEEKNAIDGLDTLVDNVIIKGNTNKIQIPDAKRAEFANNFREQVFYDNATKKFLIIKELNDKNITDLVEQEYFGFMKGNIKDLVVKEAKSQNAIRLRSAVQRSKENPQGAASARSSSKTLGEL